MPREVHGWGWSARERRDRVVSPQEKKSMNHHNADTRGLTLGHARGCITRGLDVRGITLGPRIRAGTHYDRGRRHRATHGPTLRGITLGPTLRGTTLGPTIAAARHYGNGRPSMRREHGLHWTGDGRRWKHAATTSGLRLAQACATSR